MGRVRIGTCSWADESLSKYWYPREVSPRERLRYYSERYDTVEVDSTFYRVPTIEMVERWAEQTPDGFVMHVKAFGVMTRHPVKLEALPPDLREGVPTDERGRVDRPPREFRALVFERFRETLEPLRSAGKLGGVLVTPLINHPEVAILGVHRIGPRPVVRDGEIVVRAIGNVSVTFDHRVVDGARAAEFGLAVIARLESAQRA